MTTATTMTYFATNAENTVIRGTIASLKKRIDNMTNRRNGNGKGRAMLAIREQTQTPANRIAEMPE